MAAGANKIKSHLERKTRRTKTLSDLHAVRYAIGAYHDDLNEGEDRYAASDECIARIQNILNMPWKPKG